MFQLYRDGLDDLLKEPIKRKKGDDEDNNKKPPPLKITLAEHSPTGLVYVRNYAWYLSNYSTHLAVYNWIYLPFIG